MKKVLIALFVIFLGFCAGCRAQKDKFSVFITREGNFPGQLVKVAQDFSVIKVDCGDELINEITGNKDFANMKSFHLGYFYLVN